MAFSRVKRVVQPRVLVGGLAGVVLGAAGGASAAFFAPTTSVGGFDALGPKTTYGEWDVFSVGTGTNSPDVNSYNDGLNPDPSIEQTLTQNSPFVGIISSGNIYSFSVVTDFDATLPAAADAEVTDIYTRVIVQTKSLGAQFDYSSFELTNGVETVEPVEERFLFQDVFTFSLPGTGVFESADIEYAAYFDIIGPPSELTLSFNAASTSASLDRIRIDTFSSPTPIGATNLPGVPIPEPASGVFLLALSTVMMARRRVNRSGR